MIRKISIVSCVLFSLLCIVFFTACGNKSDTFGNLIQGFQKEYDNPCETVRFFSLANESQRKRFEEKTLSYLNNATKGDYGELMREIGDCTSIPFDKDGKQVSIFRGANDVALAKCSFYEIKLESDNLLPSKEEDIIVKEIRPKTIENFGMQVEKGKNPPDVFYIYKSGKYQNTLYYILTEKFYLAALYVGKVENTDLPIKVFLMEPRAFSAFIHAFDKLDENSSRKKELSSLIQNSKLIKQLSEEYARLMVAANSSELRLKYGQYIYLLRQAEHERGRVDRVNQNTHSQQTNQEINKTVQKSKNEGVINSDEVNVRKGPGVKFDSLGVFFKGDKVRLVGEQGNDIGETWYQIEYDNPTVGLIKGWVRKDFININKPEDTAKSNKSYTTKQVSGVSHSSALKDGGSEYAGSLTIDGDIKTCWAEGEKGLGLGESLDFKFNDTYEISGMDIWIGYQKSQDLFKKNARPRIIDIFASDGSDETYELQDVMGSQRIIFKKPIKTNSIKLIILKATPGDKYDDTCISEVKFF